MFTTRDRGLLAVYPGLRYTRGCLAPANIVHFLFLSFAFYGMMTVAETGHLVSSVIWQNNLESSHLEGGESRSIRFLRKFAAVDKGEGG